MKLIRAWIACAAVLAAVLFVVDVATPRPFQGSGTVLVVDGIAMIVGLVAMVVLPVVLSRSGGWEAVVAVVAAAVPVYVFIVLVGYFAVPFGWAWLRCGGHSPIVTTSFAAGYYYWAPGDRGYGPKLFPDEYRCTIAEAEAAGYHRADAP